MDKAQDLIRANRGNYNSIIKKSEKSYIEYKISAEDVDKITTEYDVMEKNHEFTEENKKSIIVDINKKLKKSKESEKDYRISIYNLKEQKFKYSTLMKKLLNDYQKTEEERIESIKNAILLLIEKEEELNKSQITNYDSVREAVNKVSKELEIQNIIKEINPAKKALDEIQYKKVDVKSKKLLEKYDAYYTKGSHTAEFNFESARESIRTGIEEGKDKRTQDIENNIVKILDHCWKDKKPTEEEQTQFIKMMEEKMARKIFCECLNYYRKEGIFCLSNEGYSYVVLLLKQLVTIMERQNDVETVLSLVILTQTFYCEQKGIQNEPDRIYLQQAIADHPYFHKRKFWEEVLRLPLNDPSTSSSTDNETEEEKNYRIENEVFVKAGTYAHNMLQFKLDKSFVEEIVFEYANSNNLSKGYVEAIHVIYTII